MIIKSVELKNFRNYDFLELFLSKGVNIFYGGNAQGKTNLLEAVYMACTSKSPRSARDREMIKFGADSAHIKLCTEKKGISSRIDMHLKKNTAKGIAVNGTYLKRASELFGLANAVIFSPEDMGLIKNGPSERRRFIDLELCQLNRIYVHNLVSYNKTLNQKNRFLKTLSPGESYRDLLDIYNEQLVRYGSEVICLRQEFIENLNVRLKEKHGIITGGKEDIELIYSPDTSPGDFRENLARYEDKEIKNMVGLIGPHKDDIKFISGDKDLRHFGSQGQQRTAVLSLKLAELSLVEEITGEKPVLLLDDVLSELDRERQDSLLGSIGDIQTLMTCTGLDDFVYKRIRIDKIFRVDGGMVTGDN